MKKKKESAKEKELRMMKLRRRTYDWDKSNMNYCLENGLTIYASCQSNGRVMIFAQQGEKFIPVDNIKYSQSTEEDILIYTVAIIDAYDTYAEKIRSKKKKIKT